MCGTDTAGRGALEPPPEAGARMSYLTENSSSANRYLGRDEKKTLTESLKPKKDFIYLHIVCSLRSRRYNILDATKSVALPCVGVVAVVFTCLFSPHLTHIAS